MEDVIEAAVFAGTLEGENVLGVLYNADYSVVTPRRAAQRAALAYAKGRADIALAYAPLEVLKRLGELAYGSFWRPQHPVDQASGGLLTDTREPPKLLYGALNGVCLAHLESGDNPRRNWQSPCDARQFLREESFYLS